MYILNIEYPGTWIQLDDKDKAFELNNLLFSMENHLIDMAIVLTLFEDSYKNNYFHLDHEAEWEKNRALSQKVESEYRANLHQKDEFYHNYEFHRNEVDKLIRNEKLKKGVLPSCYSNRLPFIYAHSFLSSADSFVKFLNVLAQESPTHNILELVDDVYTNLPALRQVRNSAQHSEDRSRGYGKPADVKKKKKMKLQPISNEMIKADGGVLALSCLNGNKLGYTIDDGSYKEVEISVNTLSFIHEIFNKTLKSFDWIGPKQLKPHI
ncbi:hypothetical protein JEP63_00430 [Proteus mirabilis]|uniref:hypothetical protein n=1 Tax=Proteus TaxID=583 RepID=UPI000C9F6BA0|nr:MULTISPECIES: hypothetical protein [Proteus]ELA7633939.1 hypothetical protein [Proteus mirabilis]ELL8910589.1 hypothetical protein [Proteus mirabilis]MBI6312516.1 hypothetical protein [Proteus mirabilis]MBI6319467.1 hypothetical protein [Proteus mirabilis]NBM85336.1 hypothetical protein [Proteus sp. G2661]